MAESDPRRSEPVPGPRQALQDQPPGKVTHKRHLLAPVDGTFFVVMAAIVVLFAIVVLAATWIGV